MANQGNINADRDASRAALIEERKLREGERGVARKDKVINTFNTTQNVKKYQSAIDAADNILELISSNNPIADAAVPTYMARASGEVGNLSEADKAPFGGSRALATRMLQTVNQAESGKLTPENRQFVKQLAETMKKTNIQNRNNYAQSFAKQHAQSGIYGTEQEILPALVPDFDFNASTQTQTAGAVMFPNDPEKQARYEIWKKANKK